MNASTRALFISLAPILVINILTVISFVTFLIKRRRLQFHADVGRHNASKMLGRLFHEYWYWLIDPVARFFVNARVHPNLLTFTGFALNVVAAWLFAVGEFGYGGWTVILGSSFDLFDGRVARVTGQMSRSGAFFDSVMDRASEGAAMFGLAVYFHNSWMLPMVVLGLIGSMLVSYTRARGESVGVVCKEGLMARAERIAYLTIGSVLQPVLDAILTQSGMAPQPYLVMGALCIIGVFTVVTALHRTIFIMNALDRTDTITAQQKVLESASDGEAAPAFGLRRRDRIRFGAPRAQARFTNAVAFITDGIPLNVVRDAIARGDMPQLSRHVIEGGRFTEAISAFPSFGGPAAAAMMTGCFPGTCNLPGARWFDRTVPAEQRFTLKRYRDYAQLGAYAIDFDLSKEVRTAFEYSRQAVNLLGLVNRGALWRAEGSLTRAHLSQRGLAGRDLRDLERMVFSWCAASLRKEPDLLFYHAPSIGLCAEQCGVDHAEVRAALKRFDRTIGEVVALLKAQGRFDHSLLMWMGESGRATCTESVDLASHVARVCGGNAAQLQTPREWRTASAIELFTGNTMAHVYMRRDRAWNPGFAFEELRERGVVAGLLDHDAIDLVMGRAANGGGVWVSSRRGHARVEMNGDMKYHVGASDPFGFTNLAPRMTHDDARIATYATPYPDALTQVMQLFRAARTGDLVFTTHANIGVRDEHHLHGITASHTTTCGSLHRTHALVPFAANAPLILDLPARTVDLLPTMLAAVGITSVPPMDGRSLLVVPPD